jgi:myo-inositol catabolism protein IolC
LHAVPVVLDVTSGRSGLVVAAPIPGFDGFAVGRTLWQDALERYVAGTQSREEARDEIAGRYVRAIRAYVHEQPRA